MASVLEEYLIKFGFDVKTEGLDRTVSALNATKKLMETIREPFQAFNEALEAFTRLGMGAYEAVAGIVEFSTEAASAADELVDLSQKLGIGTEQLEFWGYAAKLSGSDTQSMTQALSFLNKEIAGASQGNKEMAEDFAKLGIKIHDTNGKLKDAGTVFEEVIGKLEQIPDEGKRAAVGMDIFSKAGLNMRGVLNLTSNGIKELRAEFALLGGQTPQELKELGQEYGDSVDRIKTINKGLQNSFALGFQPSVNAFLKWVEELAKKWGPMMRDTMKSIGEAFGSMVNFISGGVNTFVRAFLEHRDVIYGLVAAFVALNAQSALTIASMLLGWALAAAPFVILLLLVEDFFGFLEGKDSVIGRLIDNWGEWTEQIGETDPVLGAVMATIGDLANIIKVAVQYVYELWKAFDSGGLDGLVAKLKETVGVAMDYYMKMWNDFALFIGDSLADFGSKVIDLIVSPVKNVLSSLGIGGGALITPSAGSVSNNTSSVSNTNANANVTQTIHAAPGMNEREVGKYAAGAFKEMFQSELRQAYPDVVR